MGRLNGKVAWITGAAGGIGRGIARRFVAEGARVVLSDLEGAPLQAVTDELGQAAVAAPGNIAHWQANEAAVAMALEHYGRLDVFVGNAGIYDHAMPLAAMHSQDMGEAFDELFSVNVKGYLLGARAALDALLASRGNMILTASFASFSPAGGGVLYTASKHAVVGVVRQLAYELAPDIRVNGVAPGIAPTVLKGIVSLGQKAQDSVLDGTARNLPLQAVPAADAYGGLYAFLACDQDAAHITGSVFNADSGLAIRGFTAAGGRVRST